VIQHAALCVVLLGQGVPATPPPSDAAAVSQSDLAIRYRFENSQFLIPKIELTIDGAGHGRLTWERKDARKPLSRDVRVSDRGLADLRNLLVRLDFVHSTAEYQTREDHSNLGTTAIRVVQAGVSREVVFNYTQNRDADALGRLLRGIANREMYVAELEVAIQHQPLETPAALSVLAQEFAQGRIGDATGLLPLLTSMADDMALPLITRNKATELARRISKAK